MVSYLDRFYLIPSTVVNIFGNYLNGMGHRFKRLIRVGTIVVIWLIWLCRNDKVFNDKNSSFMQFIYRCSYAMFMVVSPKCGVSEPVYRDLFMEVSRQL
jgi:hypothetical protein